MEIIEKLQRKRPEIVHQFDELVRTVPDGVYLTSIKQTGNKLEINGVAQSSTRVSTFMRNIDTSTWMDNPELQVVETAKDSPTGGSNFTLFANTVGVNLEEGGETTVKKAGGKMNLLDELRTLDPQRSGPLAAGGSRVSSCVLIFAVCTGVAWYMLVWNEDRPVLQKAEADELDLRSQFENKQQRAANLDAYKAAARRRWSAASARCCASCRARPRCRICWSTSRRPASPRASARNCFSPGAEKSNGFYAELPIKIKLVGSYHQFGAFVSGIAALPRIVTLHDIQIAPVDAKSRRLRQSDHGRDRQDLSLHRG